MKGVLLYIWQLPQNMLGLLVILFSRASRDKQGDTWRTRYYFGVSLGKYIVVNTKTPLTVLRHERGHQYQSLYLGWLYLIVIGLPSVMGNLGDRWFHKAWPWSKRYYWYYSLPWEAWADKLGGVVR